MKNYIILYKVNDKAKKAMSEITPEEQQESMKQWHEWRDNLGQHLVDFGSMYFGGKCLSSNGLSELETPDMGYSLIQAESIDQAINLASTHPHLKWHTGASIDVREYFKMP